MSHPRQPSDAVVWTLLLLLMLAVNVWAACVALRAAPPRMPTGVTPTPLPALEARLGLSWAAAGDAASAFLDGPGLGLPLVKEIYGPSSCRPLGGVNPGLKWVSGKPRPGTQVFLSGFSRHGRPEPPAATSWFILSVDTPFQPIDWTPFGTPGCELLVSPQHILWVPESLPDPGQDFQIYRQGGFSILRWTPRWWNAGQTLRVQLLVLAPGENQAGFLSSNGIEIYVGS